MSPDKISDERLEELREAYQHLADNPGWQGSDRQPKDREHALLFAELQRHREHVCLECEGRTFIQNTKARWYRDSDGCEGTNDPEEIECPRCNGVGYEPPPRRPDEPRLPTAQDIEELPF